MEKTAERNTPVLGAINPIPNTIKVKPNIRFLRIRKKIPRTVKNPIRNTVLTVGRKFVA